MRSLYGVGMDEKLATPEPHDLYVAFMEELKVRLSAIQELLQQSEEAAKSPHGFFLAEGCFLQTRFICELLALACLALHEPLLSEKLKGEWNADVIFGKLEQLNADFFPQPITIQPKEGAPGEYHVTPAAGLTRFDMKKMYHKCGSQLHRGMIGPALAGEQRQYDLGELSEWCAAYWALLSHHVILLPHSEEAFLVNLTGGPNGGTLLQHAKADGPFVVTKE